MKLMGIDFPISRRLELLFRSPRWTRSVSEEEGGKLAIARACPRRTCICISIHVNSPVTGIIYRGLA